jgi:hypothetical protein
VCAFGAAAGLIIGIASGKKWGTAAAQYCWSL